MSFVLKAVALFLAFFVYFPKGDADGFSAKEPGDVALSFTVLSDGHMESNSKQKHHHYANAFRDISASQPLSDALVMLGDNTMNGQAIETSLLYGLMSRYNDVPNVFMLAGNHDLSENNSGDYEKHKKRFITFHNAFLTPHDMQIEELYNFYVLDDYYFIMLGSETDAGIQQYLSEKQLNWLQSTLDAAKASGKAVFLFNHWPVNDVFDGIWDEGHMGEQSAQVVQLLENSGCDIYFFSGHLHRGLYEDSRGVLQKNNVTYINVPSFGSQNNTDPTAAVQDTGMGFHVEVYEEKIIMRCRNFVKAEWLDGYEYEFEISN